jgi:chromosome segregation ATPase
MSDKQLSQLWNKVGQLQADLQAYHDVVREHLEKQMASFDDLAREVRESRDTVDAVLTFIQGLKQQLKDSNYDPAKLDELISDLDSQQAKLAEAVAQTPASPSQPPPVEAPVDPAPEVPPEDPGSSEQTQSE